MKKVLVILSSMIILIGITACGNKNIETNKNNNQSQQNNSKKEEPKKEDNNQNNNNQNNNVVIDDEDNNPDNGERVAVESIINCDGCVFAYFSDEGDRAKKLGDTITTDEYTTDINNIRTMGNKQRHNFFGLVLSGNTISKAYACILKENKIYCIQGSTDGTYFSNNIGVLNQIFTTEQCRYISDGHTYTCTDNSYNGDTKTSGYTSLHYETSCTIYGADSNTGKLICH